MAKNEITRNSTRAWMLASRPKTLAGAAVPVAIGLALAWADTPNAAHQFNWVAAILCLLFAFVMQIDANFVNDYFDYVKGTDDAERRLGPRRACAQGWVTPRAMRLAMAITTGIACAIGLPLVLYGGIEMILVGATCVVFCFLYTTYLSYVGLGDVLVIIFFGLVPVCITYYIQLHSCTWQVFVASAACGFVIDTLLIINNYRDRDLDREKGKTTIVVRLGAQNGRRLYLSCGITGCIGGIVFALFGHPLAFALPLVTYLPLHASTYRKIVRIDRGKALNACLGETSRNMLVYGLAVCAGLLIW